MESKYKILVIQTTPTSWLHKLPTNKEMNVESFWNKWELLNEMCLKKYNRSLSDIIKKDTQLCLGFEGLNKELKRNGYNWNQIEKTQNKWILEIEL